MSLADDLSGLYAWANVMPGSRPRLHVEATMKVRHVGDGVTLEPIAADPADPSVARFRVVIAPRGQVGTEQTGTYPIDYVGPYTPKINAVQLIFSDASTSGFQPVQIAE